MTFPIYQSDELWISQATDATGAAPAGKYFAINTVTGDEFKRNAANGNWEPRTVSSVDLNLTRSVTAGNAPAIGTIPAALAADTARDTGDLHNERFDDFLVWYSKTATVWVEDSRIELNAAVQGLWVSQGDSIVAGSRTGVLTDSGTATADIDGVTYTGAEVTLQDGTSLNEQTTIVMGESGLMILSGKINGDVASRLVCNVPGETITTMWNDATQFHTIGSLQVVFTASFVP